MKRNNNTKRSSNKKNRRSDPSMGIIRLPKFGYPDKIISTLRYHDYNIINSASGVVNTYQYRLNSTFDPDFTSAGHQPMFRDIFAAIYDQYSVISCKVTIKFVNTDTTHAISCGVVIDDDSTPATGREQFSEQTHGQHTLLPPLAGSLSSKTFVVLWDCEKILGIDPFASETYKTAVGSNPTETSFLDLWAVDAGLSATVALGFDIELEYTTLWTELATPNLS